MYQYDTEKGLVSGSYNNPEEVAECFKSYLDDCTKVFYDSWNKEREILVDKKFPGFLLAPLSPEWARGFGAEMTRHYLMGIKQNCEKKAPFVLDWAGGAPLTTFAPDLKGDERATDNAKFQVLFGEMCVDPEYKTFAGGIRTIQGEVDGLDRRVGKTSASVTNLDQGWRFLRFPDTFKIWNKYFLCPPGSQEAGAHAKISIGSFNQIVAMLCQNRSLGFNSFSTEKELGIFLEGPVLLAGRKLSTNVGAFEFPPGKGPKSFHYWEIDRWKKNVFNVSMATLLGYAGVPTKRTGGLAQKVSEFRWNADPTVSATLIHASLGR